MVVNGREYPLWSQFVEKKNEWIGGMLDYSGDSMDRAMDIADDSMQTKIVDIVLKPN